MWSKRCHLQGNGYSYKSVFRSELYSEGKGKEREWFHFPSCICSRIQIGTEYWAVSPGISIMYFCLVPSKGTLPEHQFCTRCTYYKHNPKPIRPTCPSCTCWLGFQIQWSHLLYFFWDFLKFECLETLECKWLFGNWRIKVCCPEERCRKQLQYWQIKNLYSFAIFELPCLILSFHLYFSLQMMFRWHTVSAAHGSEALLSLICGRILM